MTATGLEKSDFGENPSHTALKMHYPTGKIISAQWVQAVVNRYASALCHCTG